MQRYQSIVKHAKAELAKQVPSSGSGLGRKDAAASESLQLSPSEVNSLVNRPHLPSDGS